MRISGSGYIGMGFSGYSSVKLSIKGTDTTSANQCLICYDSSEVTSLLRVRNDGLIGCGNTTNSPYNYATTGRSAIYDSSGNFGYLVSTRESKANIESIKSIDYINQLNPVQFNYRKKDIDTNEYTDELYDNITYGFIADEVEKVNKDLVFYNSDGTTLAGVEYNSMIAIVIKGYQDQQLRIEAQDVKIEELKQIVATINK